MSANIKKEYWVSLPNRFVLDVPRSQCMLNTPHKNENCYIDLEVATWVHANRGLIEQDYQATTYSASFLDDDAAMMFKLTFPHEP